MTTKLEELKTDLLKVYPNGNITCLSVKANNLYRRIYYAAQKCDKTVKEFIEEDLGLNTLRKSQVTIKQLKEELLELYPDKVVKSLAGTDSDLYKRMYNSARHNYAMDINEFMEEKLGFTVDKDHLTFIDTKTLEYIENNFDDFKHSLVYDHLDYSKQYYFVKLDKKFNYTGEWQIEELDNDIKHQVMKLVENNKDILTLKNKLIKILHNADGYNVLYIDFNKEEGYFSKLNDKHLVSMLEEKKYATLYRGEYLLYKELLKHYDPIEITQPYYEILTSKDNLTTLRNYANRHGFTSLKDYIENEWGLRYIQGNSNSPDEMHDILSNYLIKKPNFVHIDTSNINRYSFLARKARNLFPGLPVGEAFELLCKRYGFIHIDDTKSISTKKGV